MRSLSVILFILLITACVNDEICISESSSDVKLEFIEYKSDPESTLTITFDSIGISGDPVAYPDFADTTVSTIGLNVDPDSSRTLFVFVTTERLDTLEVGYRVTPSLISVDCGPELLFSKLDTLYHTFDSVALIQQIFDKEVETNIKIYY